MLQKDVYFESKSALENDHGSKVNLYLQTTVQILFINLNIY